jgi:hypothetical protein
MKKLGIDKEDLDIIRTNNDRLPETVKLTETELMDLMDDRVYLGLVAKASRALAFISKPTDSTVDFVHKNELNYFATRAEVIAVENSLEGTGQMLMGVYETLKSKGLITDEELYATLRKLAQGIAAD